MKTNDIAVSYLHPETKQEGMLDNLRVGIIGGSEFVWPLAKYAVGAGLDVSVLCPEGNGKRAMRNASFIAGEPSAYCDVLLFGKGMDLLTVADERVDINALKELCAMGVKVFPGPDMLELIRDKNMLKDRMVSYNIPVVKGWVVAKTRELMTYEDEHAEANDQYGSTVRRGGYLKMDTLEDIGIAEGDPAAQQAKLDLKKEISVVVARSGSGVVQCFYPAIVILDGERLMTDFSLCPATIGRELAMSACLLAARVAEATELEGTICVELVLAGNGKLYVNDLSLRPGINRLSGLKEEEQTTREWQLRQVLELGHRRDEDDRMPAVIDIPELQAHKKFVVREALKVVLCTDDFGSPMAKKTGKRLHAFPSTDLQHDELISKAVVVKYLLAIGK